MSSFELGIASCKIVNDKTWAKNHPNLQDQKTGTIVFNDQSAGIVDRWDIDLTSLSTFSIQHYETKLFAYAQGDRVVTVSESEVPPESLNWEIRSRASGETIGVPDQDLLWTVDGENIVLTPAPPTGPSAKQCFVFKQWDLHHGEGQT